MANHCCGSNGIGMAHHFIYYQHSPWGLTMDLELHSTKVDGRREKWISKKVSVFLHAVNERLSNVSYCVGIVGEIQFAFNCQSLPWCWRKRNINNSISGNRLSIMSYDTERRKTKKKRTHWIEIRLFIFHSNLKTKIKTFRHRKTNYVEMKRSKTKSCKKSTSHSTFSMIKFYESIPSECGVRWLSAVHGRIAFHFSFSFLLDSIFRLRWNWSFAWSRFYGTCAFAEESPLRFE